MVSKSSSKALKSSNNAKPASVKKKISGKAKDRHSIRKASGGDTSGATTQSEIETFEVGESVDSARQSKIVAVRDIVQNTPPHDINTLAEALEAIIDGASPDDATVLRNALLKKASPRGVRQPNGPDDQLSGGWRDGAFPYRNLMSRKNYEKQKYRLQVELLKLQAWVRKNREKLVIVFEGRDAAGKGGTIKRFMEHLNPRGSRVVALEKPSESEQGQWYFQRYVEHLPTAGEIVMFDRSWYNRAGVERVMGFCTQDEYSEFMRQSPEFERNLVRSGIHLIKFWFSVSQRRAETAVQGTQDSSAQAVEAIPDRHGVTRQVG